MSNLTRELFFSVPFFYCDVENVDELNRKLVHNILKWKEEDTERLAHSNKFSWHSQTDMNLREEFHQITKIINDAQNEISINEEYCSKSNLVVKDMWANVSQKYAYNSYHCHPNSLWSGVYYVQCPPNCGNIKFYNKDATTMWWPRYEKMDVTTRQSHQWDDITYEPVEGRLILFLSHVGHEVSQNLTDVEGKDGYRISISFNSRQKEK